MAKKKVQGKKKAGRRKPGPLRRKPAPRKKSAGLKKRKKRQHKRKKKPQESAGIEPVHVATFGRRGLGARSAGQSGDTQGLSRFEGADSESVRELVEEGQDFEAGVIAGVEEADDDQGEVRTKQVREDDVPREYLDED